MSGVMNKSNVPILLLIVVYFGYVTSEVVENTKFIPNIPAFAVKEDVNSSKVRTLQKEEVGLRYASFAPVRNTIRFKEIPDNALSSSSYSRGLLHHEHSGYGLHDGYFEDGSHYGHGYDYHDDGHHDFGHHDDHHGHDVHYGHGDHHYGHGHGHHDDHGHGHHDGHGHGHHHGHGHGHHHKHHDHHHLASKALLWPIAGIALLGAAAALVTNPVLLQLGVVSGRRRRRDTVEVSGPDYASKEDDFPLDPYAKQSKNKENNKMTTNKPLSKIQKSMKGLRMNPKLNYKHPEDNKFIPIPLKLKGD